MVKRYDLVIVGAGPGGLSAAINASSEGLETLVIDASFKVGGQSRFSAAIENYLGFPQKVTGQQLATRAERQAKKFGAEIVTGTPVLEVTQDGDDKILRVAVSNLFGEAHIVCKSLVLACGLQWRELNTENESRFSSSILYGGDKNLAQFYRGKKVVIVGGGNSAGQAALHWSRFATVIIAAKHSLESTMSQYLIDRIKSQGIEVITETQLERLEGENRLTTCVLHGGEATSCEVVIPFIGAVPRTEFAHGVCHCDDDGYLTDAKCEGVFVVGDCRRGSVKRIAAAVGEGSQIIPQVHKYLAGRAEQG